VQQKKAEGSELREMLKKNSAEGGSQKRIVPKHNKKMREKEKQAAHREKD